MTEFMRALSDLLAAFEQAIFELVERIDGDLVERHEPVDRWNEPAMNGNGACATCHAIWPCDAYWVAIEHRKKHREARRAAR